MTIELVERRAACHRHYTCAGCWPPALPRWARASRPNSARILSSCRATPDAAWLCLRSRLHWTTPPRVWGHGNMRQAIFFAYCEKRDPCATSNRARSPAMRRRIPRPRKASAGWATSPNKHPCENHALSSTQAFLAEKRTAQDAVLQRSAAQRNPYLASNCLPGGVWILSNALSRWWQLPPVARLLLGLRYGIASRAAARAHPARRRRAGSFPRPPRQLPRKEMGTGSQHLATRAGLGAATVAFAFACAGPTPRRWSRRQ